MTKGWVGKVPVKDDFGQEVKDVFIDGKTIHGPWAIMTEESFINHGIGLGTGKGQMYSKSESKWVKVAG